DRPVGDAAVAVQAVRLRESPGGTGFEAEGAAPAEIGERLVRRQIEAQEQLAEQEPGAGLGMEEQRVLAHRPEPRPRRQLAFQDRPGIHVAPGFATGERITNARLNYLQPLRHHLVVVRAPGVAGHPAPEISRRLRLPRAVLSLQGMVLERHAEDAARSRENLRGTDPRLAPTFHVAHA